MKTVTTNMTVGDFCEALDRKDITVNRDYQRSDKVWPPQARSFLIETIILDYPMPKLALHQVTDLKARKTRKEIVDGQQRSAAILDFYNGKYRLSQTLATTQVRGKKFDELSEDLREKYISYSLSIDLFTNTSEREIREAFRRMNSYTIPLNAEEKRHSTFQGEFKFFIYDLTKLYDSPLIAIGVFNEKQSARMADAKLFADVTYAMLNGIKTTVAKNLDEIYRDKDIEFLEKDEIYSRIKSSIDYIINMPSIHTSSLMKPQIMYGLLLAVADTQSPIPGLHQGDSGIPINPNGFANRNSIEANLTALSEALSSEERQTGEIVEFIEATSKTTNEVRRRKIVFGWLKRALTEERIIP